MAKYYVLTNIDSYDKGIMPFDDLAEALSYYEEWMGYDMHPVLVQKLEVKLSVEEYAEQNTLKQLEGI